ncbi:MAG: DUF1851 domain-containing protein [Hyphomonadaceae bacterium]|nr:DUF1851 domain-containing protein [Hyphomonadaceae bacterium]
MDPRDYVIDHAAWRTWGRMLAGWNDLLPPSFNIFLVNRFGDVIVVVPDGSVHILDVGAGLMPRIANDLEEFVRILPDYASNWLLVPLADECDAAGLVLGEGEIYSWKRPPLLGGAYHVSNIGIVPLETHYRDMADIHRQTRDLPDGTPVTPRPYKKL